MLIVVIIVGILSATILPRLTGYMARTRDLKRQTSEISPQQSICTNPTKAHDRKFTTKMVNLLGIEILI